MKGGEERGFILFLIHFLFRGWARRTGWGGSTGSVRPGADLGFKTSTNEQDQVLKSRSGSLPKVNTRVFFLSPFSGGLPGVNTRVFF